MFFEFRFSAKTRWSGPEGWWGGWWGGRAGVSEGVLWVKTPGGSAELEDDNFMMIINTIFKIS